MSLESLLEGVPKKLRHGVHQQYFSLVDQYSKDMPTNYAEKFAEKKLMQDYEHVLYTEQDDIGYDNQPFNYDGI